MDGPLLGQAACLCGKTVSPTMHRKLIGVDQRKLRSFALDEPHRRRHAATAAERRDIHPAFRVNLPIVESHALLPHPFDIVFLVQWLPIFHTIAIPLLKEIVGVAFLEVLWLRQRLLVLIELLDRGAELFKEELAEVVHRLGEEHLPLELFIAG